MKIGHLIIALAVIITCFVFSGCGFNWQWLLHGSGDSSETQTEDAKTPAP